jgi:predicted amidohydrolase
MGMEVKKKVRIAASRVGRNDAPPEADPYSASFTIEAAKRHGELNLERTLNTFRMAGEAGADVVVSIEHVMSFANVNAYEKYGILMRLVEEIPGPTSEKLSALSKKYNMYTATNYQERDGDKCYNTTVLIGRDGKIIGKYRKVHLPASEHWNTTPGSEYPVYETDIGRIGFSICHDIAFPEQCRIMAINGADIILHATGGWGFVHNNGYLGLAQLQVRAAENCVYLANAYSFNALRPGSSSCIISSRGELLAENQSQTVDGLAIADITTDYAMLDEDIMWNYFAGLPSERMRLMNERAPETYGALTAASPPIAGKFYPQYKYAKTPDEFKEMSNRYDQARQNENDGVHTDFWNKKW